MNETRLTPFWLAVLALVAVLPYLGILGADYTLDDHVIVESNPRLQRPIALREILLTNYWGKTLKAGLYRPLTLLSFAVDRSLAGREPWFGHLVNLLLHGAVAVLVALTGRTVGLTARAAWLAGALFGLHPAASEAVCGLVGRAELLAAVSALGALLLTSAALVRAGSTRITLLAGAGLAALAAPLCKEGAVVAGLLPLLLLDRRHRWRPPAVVLAGIPLLGSAGALAIRRAVLGAWLRPATVTVPFRDNPLAGQDVPDRLLGAGRVVLEALRVIGFPLRLSADHGFDQVPVSGRSFTLLALLGFGLVLLLALLAHRSRRKPGVTAGFILAALAYLPVSHLLFPTGALFAERTLYLPLAGLSLAAMGLGRGLLEASPRLRPAAPVALALLLTLLGGRTHLRSSDWQDDLTLFRSAVRASPRSAKAHYNYGTFLAAEGRQLPAEAEYREALAIDAAYADARYNLAESLHTRGESAEAAHVLSPLLESEPEDPQPRVLMGVILTALGELDLARRALIEATRIDAEVPEAWINLGILSMASGAEGEALAAGRKALLLRPEDPAIHRNMARIYRTFGYVHEAQAEEERARELANRGS